MDVVILDLILSLREDLTSFCISNVLKFTIDLTVLVWLNTETLGMKKLARSKGFISASHLCSS